MAYLGEPAKYCPGKMYDFRNAYAVAVSGSSPNFCGHLILNLGGCGPQGLYIHATGDEHGNPYWYPLMLTQGGYVRYLAENHKIEWRRWRVPVPRPDGAQARLETLLQKKYLWAVLPHNCVAFVEDIVQHGGAKNEVWSACPALIRSFR